MAGREDDAWRTEEITPGVTDYGPGPSPARAAGARTDQGPSLLPGPDASSTELFPSARRSRQGVTRRERRQTITFLAFFSVIVVLGLLALAAYFGKLDIGVGSGRPDPLPTCPPAPSASLQSFADTSVNVYNASSRSGLAMTTMRDLQKRGFTVPSAPANDPLRAKVTTMAVIRHGPSGELAARTVASVVAGEVTYVRDDRPGTDVDLVLGQTFALKPLSAAASPSPSGPAPSPTCVPAS